MGYCIGYLIGLGIPNSCNDKPYYLLFILALPLISASLQLLLLFLIFTLDSPKSLYGSGDFEGVFLKNYMFNAKIV